MVAINIQEEATLLHEGDSSLLYMANLPEHGGKVVLKLPKDPLDKETVLQLENEYSMLRQFSSSRIRHLIGKAEINHQPALLMKYIEGLSLQDYLKQHKPAFSERLIIALSLCQLLEEVHSQNVLHGNFCSNNIIVHPAILSTTLIDFKLASPVPQQVQEADIAFGPALPYMAPELSGKTSGTADERADLYSLGVVLYEMFAEVLPFTVTDSQVLIHAHLAVDPPPLQQQAPAIPQTLAEMIHKLLAKSPETRYQTAAGVQADFEQCIALQEQKGKITPFKIACFDSAARLRLPNALIGREAESQQLRMVWQRASIGAAEVFWIAGQAGIGKTSLAGQVKLWAKKARGQVAYGKFDLLSGSKPYDGLVQALNGLIELWLTKDEDELAHWRSGIQQAVDREGKLLTDLMPRLRLLLGNQPPLAPLDGPEAQHRFHYVFRNFLKALAAARHPLVLQLDDLQWADAATLAFLQELLNDAEFSHFLFIGIYRAEEARENYRLLQLLQQQATAMPMHRLVLANMEIKEVGSFLAETFQENSPAITELATVLYAKTKGNPLFITQFLRSIYQQELLWLEPAKGGATRGRWAWNLEKITQLPQTENVLSLIISRFNQLDGEMQLLLQTAACIGNQFDRNVLLALTGKKIRHPLSVLSRALQEGYFTKLSDGESAVRLPVYRFLHDRLLQAVRSTLAAETQQQLHLQLGRLLHEKMAQQEDGEGIFDLVTHLKKAQDLLTEEERTALAHLSLQAADKALAAAGYSVALDYLESGLSQLPAYSWQLHYKLSLALFTGAAQAAFLQGAFDKMEGYIAEVLQHARQEADKARVVETKIQAQIARNQSAAAVDTALKALSALGVKIPARPSKVTILTNLLQTEIMLQAKGMRKLVSLPPMTDVHAQAAMQIMAAVGSAVSRSAPGLFPLFICRLIQLSLKKGNALASIPAYSGYGVLQVAVFKKARKGYAYGKIAVQLLDTLPADAVVAKTHLVNAAFLDFWLHPIQNSIAIARQVYETGLKNGDFEFAASGLLVQCTHSYFAGVPLMQLAQTMDACCQAMLQLKQELLYQQLRLFQQVVLNLMQEDGLSAELQGPAFDEALVFTKEFTETNKTATFYLHLQKLILSYLAADYKQAASCADMLASREDHVMATIALPVYIFYDGLLQARLYPSLPLKQQKKSLRRLAKATGRMKAWAQDAPANFMYKYQLLQAEHLRITGKAEKAKIQYEQAAESASQQGFLQGKALAHELAGQHLQAGGKYEQAGFHLQLAYTTYLQWGARAKAAQLLRAYPALVQGLAAGAGRAAMAAGKKTLPVESLLKAATALSSQMKLDKMLENLLTTVLQQAGAQQGYIILNKDDVLEVAAKGAAGQPEIELLSDTSVEEYQEIPAAIINLTYRTGEELILSDAQEDNRFAHDATIIMLHIRSVLCFPVIRQQRVLGIIYLHNTLSTGAFTDTQLQVLRLLSGQIAVALENALLYTQLEQRVEERTRELLVQQQILKYKNEELQQLNDEKDELVNIVAHDLRSPLNQIRGLLNLIKLSPDNLTPDQQQFLDLGLKSSERLSNMIGRILDTNAMDAHEIALHLEMVDLDILLEEVVTNFRIQASEKDITLQLILPEEPIEIELDRNYTIQVLENLLSNALKFSPPETQVQVLLYADEDVARIEVVDEGPGISEKDQKRLFSRFQTLTARPTAGEASSGLGLSIAKRYVEAMGGNIGCSSEMGEGSTFYVEFVLV